jgi:putative transposase
VGILISDFSDWPLFMPATTYSSHVARAPSPAKRPTGDGSQESNAQTMDVHPSQTNIPRLFYAADSGARGRALTRSMSNALLGKYRYRRRLPHLQKADCDLFITFCTARSILPPEARDIVLEHCLREGGILPFAGAGARPTPRIHLHALVVMPDHVHLLLMPKRDGQEWPFPLVDILQCMKSATAHRINRQLRVSGPVWEEEWFDHLLRSDESLAEKCEYIRQNPVRRGLVRRPEDYRWLWVDASFRR